MNKPLAKAIRILKLLSDSDKGLTISEIAEQLSLPKTSVFDIAHTFADEGLLIVSEDTHRYMLGPELCRLGMKYLHTHPLVDLARVYLEKLHEAYDQTTIFMTVREGNRMVYVMKINSSAAVQLTATVGSSSEILSTGLGKAALAAMPDEQIASLLTQDDFTFSNQPAIHDMDTLMDYLNRAREKGYVMDQGIDDFFRLNCVAVPILNGQGKLLAAFSVVGLQETIPEDEWSEIGRAAADIALEISALQGYAGSRVLPAKF